MGASTFDHERLDVYRFSIEYITISCRIAGDLGYAIRPAGDPWLRAAQSMSVRGDR
jgi:hypothetical protein